MAGINAGLVMEVLLTIAVYQRPRGEQSFYDCSRLMFAAMLI
jgi:hypothetical protein